MRSDTHTSQTPQATYLGMLSRFRLITHTAPTMTMSGCLGANAAVSTGAGDAVGHEQGESRVQDGVHHDD